MGGLSKFNQKWMGDFSRLQPSKGEVHFAYCTYCNSKFSVKHGGRSAVTAHESTASHQLEEKRMRQSRTIVSDVSNDNDKVMKVSAKPAMRNFEVCKLVQRLRQE